MSEQNVFCNASSFKTMILFFFVEVKTSPIVDDSCAFFDAVTDQLYRTFLQILIKIIGNFC